MSDAQRVTAPVLVLGFGVALALWVAAFLVHMPWLDLPGHIAGPVLLVAWVVAAIVAGRAAPRDRVIAVGALSGLVTSVVSLLILGAALVEQPPEGAPAPGASGLRPSMLIYIPAFLALGAAIGLTGALIGSRLTRQSPIASRQSPDWLFRLGTITAVAILALLVLGGAVTSTDSGMSIRGWPGSHGANMFLYPISLMADPQRFLEHSHRLLGTFVGLCSIVLFLYACAADRRTSVRIATAVLLAAVIVQGVLGGLRVLENNRPIGIGHGVAAQAIFAFSACIAAALSPSYKTAPPPLPTPGRWRGLTTALLVILFIQLCLGAAFRHLKLVSPGATHALYTHLAFAIVVVIIAVVTGFNLARIGREGLPLLRRNGTALVHASGLQFLLGWVAFAVIMMSERRPGPDPASGPPEVPPLEAAIGSAHQTIGALLIALAALAWFWSRRLLRKVET